MANGHILVVEDDADIATMLKIYFSGQGYDVLLASRGIDALNLALKQPPKLVILDIGLPDMSGYEVCRKLRSTARTSYIPIIFLTQRDERSDRIAGLELGADDYITKPFDIEELKLRVQNAIKSSERQNQLDPRSGLPTGQLIEEHLRSLMRSPNHWAYLDIKIRNFGSFTEVYSFVAGDEVVRFTALLVADVIDQYGTQYDYIGNPGTESFVAITHAPDYALIQNVLTQRFNEEVKKNYSFIDRERGYVLLTTSEGETRKIALMTLSVGAVSTRTYRFSDIREVTELAAEARRSGFNAGSNSQLLSSW